MRPFVSLPPGDIDGTLELTARTRLTSNSVTLTDSLLRSEPFRLSSPLLNVNESGIELQMAGRWDMLSGEWAMEDCVLRSSALALRRRTSRHASAPNHDNCPATSQCGWTSVRWQTPGSYLHHRMHGRHLGGYGGRFRETCRWPNRRVPFPLVGRQLWKTANCSANAAAASNAAVNVLASSGTDRWDTVLREPKMVCSGSARYDVGQSTLNLDRLELTTQDEQRLAVKGTFSDLSGKCLADLQGQLTYDLSNLADRARPQLGNAIHLVGQDTQSFSLHGPLRATGPSSAPVDVAIQQPPQPLVSSELSGQCGLTWTAADLFGMVVGSGQLQTRLEAGTIETGPITFPLSQGRLRVIPHFYLNHQPPLMTLDPGQVLEAIHISETMCDGWLKFVAPLVAGSTRATGTFSVTLDQTAIPLLDPKAGNVRGQLEIVQATVSPGPLAQPLLWSADLVEKRHRDQLLNVFAIAAGRSTDHPAAGGSIPAGEPAGIPQAVSRRRG